MSDQDKTFELAERFTRAVEAGDVDAIRDIYAPGVQVWNNQGRTDMAHEAAVANIAQYAGMVHDLRVEVVERLSTQDGYVQRQTMTFRTKGGTPITLPICVVAKVGGGHIVRLDEYSDSTVLAPMFAEVSAAGASG